jgi:hypothetical protein
MRKANQLLAAGVLLWSVGAASANPAMVGSNLNLRTGPGPGYRVIALMPAGVTVDVDRTDCIKGWCRVAYDRFAGYASASHLVPIASAPPPPPAEAAPVYAWDVDETPRIWNWEDPQSRDRQWRKRQRQLQRYAKPKARQVRSAAR